MSRPTFMTIDLLALSDNLARVRALAPGCSVIAMVKANAYGHGITRVAEALSSAEALGVASLEEALTLREAGVRQPIVLMEGVFYPEELKDVEQYDLHMVVHHLPHLEMLEQATFKKPLHIWLKINTGMHRLGIEPSQFPAVYERLMALPFIQKPIGLMTHFAEADRKESLATQKQIDLFNRLIANYPGPRSLSNSAGILAWKSAHGDWVRPGLMLYGASPFDDTVGLDHGLKPVMTLWSRLIAITKVKKGEHVGYGSTWIAPFDTQVGVVGVGYGDGYPQSAKNGTPVLVSGVVCPLAGRVSMDMLTVDLNNVPHAKIGDPVILWGEGLPVECVARHSYTSAYEILTRMTPRPKIEIKH